MVREWHFNCCTHHVIRVLLRSTAAEAGKIWQVKSCEMIFTRCKNLVPLWTPKGVSHWDDHSTFTARAPFKIKC